MNTRNWTHKDEWRLYGTNFLVTVSRHSEPSTEYDWRPDGEHRWAVYAYIYPPHPYFTQFEGNALYQEATANMPLHSGPSYLQYHFNENRKVCSVQVGADYHHLHDARFTHMATREQACTVFADAEELFDWLELRSTP